MKVNSQLKGAQLELVDDCPNDKSKGKITYNTECKQIQVGDGSDCRRVQDDTDVPVGMVMIWASPTPPSSDRWLLCDGTDIPIADNPELFAVIGNTYGGTNPLFSLPDYRGEFLRATSRGTNRDPNAATRSNRGDGTTGDTIGTREGHAMDNHTHSYVDRYRSLVANVRDNANDRSGAATFNANTFTTGGINGGTPVSTETRPRNVNVDYYIKRK